MNTEEISLLFSYLIVQRDLDDSLALAKRPILVRERSEGKLFPLFANTVVS